MENEQTINQSGLYCVAMLTRMNGAPIVLDQLKHHFNVQEQTFTALELARVVGEVGYKAKVINKDISHLKEGFYPVIVQHNSGDFALILKPDRNEESFFIQSVKEPRGEWVKEADLKRTIGDEIILIKKETSSLPYQTKFGFIWFFREARKYWKVLRDCVLASFFVQIFCATLSSCFHDCHRQGAWK